MKGDKIKYRGGYKYQLDGALLACFGGEEHDHYSVEVGITLPQRIETDWLILEDGWLTIKKGYAWDGPSGPTFDTPDSMRGSLVHDALYQLMRLGLLSEEYRDRADDLFQEILEEDGMPHLRAEIWGEAVNHLAAGYAKYGSEPPALIAPRKAEPFIFNTEMMGG